MLVILVHGSGMSGLVWQHQLEYFDNADALDLPGHEGVKASLELSSTLDDYVAFVRAHIEARGEDVVIVGHSLGGAVALKLALQSIDLLKGVVLIGSGARLRVMPMLLDELGKCAANDNTLPKVMYSMNDAIEEPLRARITAVMQRNGANVMLNDLSMCDRFDVMEELSNIQLPTLALVGEKDQMTPPKYAEFMVNEMPNASMQVIKGGTHMVFAEQSELVNQLIASFIKKL